MKPKFALLVAVVVALLIPVGFANADPSLADPTVIINKSLDPPCNAVACFDNTNSKANPLIVALVNGLLPPTSFDYTGPGPLTSFFIAFSGALPFEPFTCSSDIFQSCGFVNTVNTPFSQDVELFFTNGTLNPGDGITAQVAATPEPGTIALLLTGCLPLFLLARKRWAAGSIA
ncbi:MAG TPA: PEP-CTERM sorting domain-containing protein [Candidatus Acidoferrales bacterium]|nr:PEP-CTERM sorting domain-containing protein [Candidatus Acidoferrales bacterium]